jgi:hypothetical protein
MSSVIYHILAGQKSSDFPPFTRIVQFASDYVQMQRFYH